MVFIKVKLFGTLRRFSQKGTPGYWQGEIPDGSSILDLITILGSTSGEVAGAAINKENVPFETQIPDQAEIMLVTPMGGG